MTSVAVPGSEAREDLRVAMVLTRSDGLHGQTVHVRDLALALRHHGIDARVVIGGSGPAIAHLAECGLDVRAVPSMGREIDPARDVRALRELRTTLRTLDPDVIAAHTAKAGFLARVAAAVLRVPAVYTPHCWSFDCGDHVNRRHLAFERAGARLPGAVIHVSDYERRQGMSFRVGRRNQLQETIHNGIPDVTEDLRADPRNSTPRLVVVSRFEPQKDQPTLLRALGELVDLPWSADLVGSGPLLDSCRRLASQLRVDTRVRFLGSRDDVPTRLADSDVFVLATNWESFPLSVLEAMRAGLPVVATDVGGVSEAVEHGVTGLLVPRGDAAGLREGLEMLLADPDARVRMGRAGREVYEQRFTDERMATATADLYRRVTAGRGRRGRRSAAKRGTTASEGVRA